MLEDSDDLSTHAILQLLPAPIRTQKVRVIIFGSHVSLLFMRVSHPIELAVVHEHAGESVDVTHPLTSARCFVYNTTDTNPF